MNAERNPHSRALAGLGGAHRHRHNVVPAVMAAAALLLTGGPSAAQWQKNKYQLEKEWAAQYEPSPLVCECKATGSLQVMRVRFYADAEYRSAGHWQDAVKRQLAEMNGMLGPSFGVRLEAESIRRWDRKGASGALAGMLKELETHDAGADVDWVVGLVSPLPLVSMSFHDLGYAGILSRHFVVRGMSSIAELDAFNQVFQALDRDQREKLYGRRKAHKEMVVFLHEWAHTLGAFHVEDPTAIMGPGYSQRSSRLAAADADLVAAGLQARIVSRGSESTDWTPLRERLAQIKSHAWSAVEVNTLVAHLRKLAEWQSANRGKPAAAGAPTELSPAAAALGLKSPAPATAVPEAGQVPKEQQLKAQQALAGGNLAEARAAVESGLRGSTPPSAELLVTACELEMRAQKVDKAARHCAAAIAADEKNARAHHLMGRIFHHRRKPDAAIESLTRSIKLDPTDRAVWEFLGDVYRSQGRSRDYQKFLIDYAELSPAR